MTSLPVLVLGLGAELGIVLTLTTTAQDATLFYVYFAYSARISLFTL